MYELLAMNNASFWTSTETLGEGSDGGGSIEQATDSEVTRK